MVYFYEKLFDNEIMILTYHDLRNYSQTFEPRDSVLYSLDGNTYPVHSYNPRSNFLTVLDNGQPREILLFYVQPIYENYTFRMGE